jgi:hypothetical protein
VQRGKEAQYLHAFATSEHSRIWLLLKLISLSSLKLYFGRKSEEVSVWQSQPRADLSTYSASIQSGLITCTAAICGKGMLREDGLQVMRDTVQLFTIKDESQLFFFLSRGGTNSTFRNRRFFPRHKVSKAIAVTGRAGLQGCEMLRFTHCLANRRLGCKPDEPAALYSPETFFSGSGSVV